MSQDGAAARDSSNRLSPPLFELPDNMNDYEVWTVRLPASLNVDSLQGVELDVSGETATFPTQDDNEQQLRMTRGQASDNEQFRLLIRDNEFLVPHNRPFDRHYNISSLPENVAEAQLAPRLELAPEPSDTVRQSYSHIPQVAGLKRRWMPPGGGSVAKKERKHQETNGSIETSAAAAAPTTRKSEPETPACVTASVASSTDTPPSSNRRPKEEPYRNGEHVSSKKKAKKHKKDKKKKKKRRSSSKVKSED